MGYQSQNPRHPTFNKLVGQTEQIVADNKWAKLDIKRHKETTKLSGLQPHGSWQCGKIGGLFSSREGKQAKQKKTQHNFWFWCTLHLCFYIHQGQFPHSRRAQTTNGSNSHISVQNRRGKHLHIINCYKPKKARNTHIQRQTKMQLNQSQQLNSTKLNHSTNATSWKHTKPANRDKERERHTEREAHLQEKVHKNFLWGRVDGAREEDKLTLKTQVQLY